MASSQVITHPKLSILFFIISTLFMISTFASAHQFQLGWSKPSENDTESYDDWAERNRFHVGDIIDFKYENDSMLVVDRDDYRHCDVTNPISQLNDGNSVFQFNRYGFFYFISGEPGHCKSGQRVIIRVMVHPDQIVEAPNIAPTPQASRGGDGEGGGDWGGHVVTPNSTVRLPVASYFMTALGGVMVILYLFM